MTVESMGIQVADVEDDDSPRGTPMEEELDNRFDLLDYIIPYDKLVEFEDQFPEAMRDPRLYWQKRDGSYVEIATMDTDHLRNCLRMLKRAADSGQGSSRMSPLVAEWARRGLEPDSWYQ